MYCFYFFWRGNRVMWGFFNQYLPNVRLPTDFESGNLANKADIRNT